MARLASSLLERNVETSRRVCFAAEKGPLLLEGAAHCETRGNWESQGLGGTSGVGLRWGARCDLWRRKMPHGTMVGGVFSSFFHFLPLWPLSWLVQEQWQRIS